MLEMDKLNKAKIIDLQKIIDGEQAAIKAEELAKGDSKVIENIRKEAAKAKGELDNLKAEGSTLANYFKGHVSQALSDSFIGLVDGTMTGKQAMQSFAKSFEKLLMDMVAKEIQVAIIEQGLKAMGSAILGALGNAFGSVGASGLPNGTNISSNSNFIGPVQNADGNVYSSPSISAFSGSIVDKPTFFASGGNVMGEAGPEAILPLKRNSKGKLGVSIDNGGQSGSTNSIIIQNLSVTVKDKEDSTSQEQAKLIGETIKAQLKGMIQQELVVSKRSGGILNPTSMSATF